MQTRFAARCGGEIPVQLQPGQWQRGGNAAGGWYAAVMASVEQGSASGVSILLLAATFA